MAPPSTRFRSLVTWHSIAEAIYFLENPIRPLYHGVQTVELGNDVHDLETVSSTCSQAMTSQVYADPTALKGKCDCAGKGGSDFSARGKSKNEVIRFCQVSQ